ncbi:hypothetical protein VIGAN_05117100, partial [Vigna angularis var. angularis]
MAYKKQRMPLLFNHRTTHKPKPLTFPATPPFKVYHVMLPLIYFIFFSNHSPEFNTSHVPIQFCFLHHARVSQLGILTSP